MRHLAAGLLSFVALTSLGSAAWAQVRPQAADVVTPTAAPAPPRRFFFGVTGGVGFVNAAHPQIGEGSFVGPLLGLQVGYTLAPSWSLSLHVTDIASRVTRLSGSAPFDAVNAWPQAACNGCHPRLKGGDLLETDIHLTTLAPRLDFTPFGAFGPFAAVSGGLAVMHGVEGLLGGQGAALVGLRLHPAAGSSLKLEGGVQGQAYEQGGSAATYFVALAGDLHL